MAQVQPHVCPIIVGRDRELSVVSRLLAGVAGSRCEMLLVSGEAGIGKSRLARALTGVAQDREFRILEGICDERDRDLPFAVFIDCLRQELHGRPGHQIGQLLEKDAEVFARLVPELRPPGQERSPLTAEQEKRRIFEAFTDLFVGLSGEAAPAPPRGPALGGRDEPGVVATAASAACRGASVHLGHRAQR